MGLPTELVEQLAAVKPQGFEVWPQNMSIVTLFLAIATQWDTVALGDGRLHWLGLDYARARAGFALAGMTVDPDEWAGVQVMERAAAAAMNGFAG